MMTDTHDPSDYKTAKIEKYIFECEEKAKYHQKQSQNALNFHNLFGIINVTISSSQMLVMIFQGTFSVENVVLAVTGGSFAFVSLIFSRLSMSYNFNSLSVLHSIVSDDFFELAQNFRLLLNDPEGIDNNLYSL